MGGLVHALLDSAWAIADDSCAGIDAMLVDGAPRRNSHLMAEVLNGSWRSHRVSEVPSADVIPLITALSLKSGTAALVWWRFKSLAGQAGDLLSPFQHAFS